MSSGFTNTDPKPTRKKQDNGFFTQANIPGKITETIGSGENAKDTFIYLTLKWSFYTGVILTAFVVANNWFFVENKKVPNIMDDLKGCWGIVVPLITLALGYAFGKSKV